MMPHITFISTIHKDIGRSNSTELYKIIDEISPEVVFLEAIVETYSDYEKYLFSTYGVYHKKLEISALQKYNRKATFQYVPVCDNGLSDTFQKKIKFVCQNRELQKLIDNFNSLAANYGFEFLNSKECISHQEEMRALESQILINSELEKVVNEDIEAYEKSMIQNIYSYCFNNIFSSAIFMCGAAHRKSIIEIIKNFRFNEQHNLSWALLNNSTIP